MGYESDARLRRGRTRVQGRAQLEGDFLLFRGDGVREKVNLSSISAVEAKGEVLSVTHAMGALELALAPGVAERWVTKIRNPKSRLDKLGVKPGMIVAIIDVEDAALRDELRDRGASVASEVSSSTAIVFLGAESRDALSRLAPLRKRIPADGAIWVVHRKGKGATLKDVEVFAAAKAAGLVDNKVVSFSETHTAERLVIPLAQRKAR